MAMKLFKRLNHSHSKHTPWSITKGEHMTISFKVAFVVFAGLGVTCLAKEDEENQRMYDEFEQAMFQQIGRIHADCQAIEVEKAEKLRRSYPSAVAETPFGSNMRQFSKQMRKEGRYFALDIKFLQAIFAAHDPDYDFHNQPHPVRPFPPIPSFGGIIDPEEIEDVVVREKYKKEIEEYKRQYIKYMRERSLDSMRKHLIFFLQNELKFIKSMKPSRLPYVVTLLDETIEDKGVKRAIFAGTLYLKDERGIDYLVCDNPPTPPVDGVRRFLTGLPPDLRQKIIGEVKTMYTEEELKILDTPLPVKPLSAIPVEQARSHASRLSPATRKQFLDMAKEKSDYTEEELKMLDAPFE
jgi:hypothetical protein